MDTPPGDSAPSRRRLLQGAVGFGTATLAGCLDLTSSGSDADPHLGICEVIVSCTAEEDVTHAVDLAIRRDGETVYDETHRLPGGRAIHLRATEHDWMGSDRPYRVTVDPHAIEDTAVYDTAEESRYANCHGYAAFFDGSGISGGAVYDETVD